MGKLIGKIAAVEKNPTTIDDFYFWTDKNIILNPFDVVKVEHISKSITYGVIEEISHITDAASFLSSFISNDFGNVDSISYTNRIGMNYVKAKVIANSSNIYTPVHDGCKVSLADKKDVEYALGLSNIKNPLPCGFLEMYDGADKIQLPVHFNSNFIIGPEGAHLNISGISGLASKTSYAMFLIKAIQQTYLLKEKQKAKERDTKDSVAFVVLNVKGRDLLALDEKNDKLSDKDKKIYEMLNISCNPLENVKFLYPYSSKNESNTYADSEDIQEQIEMKKAFKYKYIYENDKTKLEMMFSNIDDSSQTMESILTFISNDQGKFNNIRYWNEFLEILKEYCQKGATSDKEISVQSWRKFNRIVKTAINSNKSIFANRTDENQSEIRIEDMIKEIKKNEIIVVDIAKLDENMQAFVFGDVIQSIYQLKLGQLSMREDIPQKIIVFIDELNKYASKDAPKDSPILKSIIDITERGRSLGIILFSAEQFKSAIHDRVKGNCSSHAYGRTNAIEIAKNDYKYIPHVYQGMMTRLKQGEYIVQNPIFSSLLNLKFPNPVYKQYKNG